MLSDYANTFGLITFAAAVVLVASTFVKGAADRAGPSQNLSLRLVGVGLVFSTLRVLWRSMPENLELGFAIAGVVAVCAAIWTRHRARRAP